MVMNCTLLSQPAAKVTMLAMGEYRTSQSTSCNRTRNCAARVSPGAGTSTSSRARNTTVPNTFRIGCEKLPAVYGVAGLASGKPQPQGADLRVAVHGRQLFAADPK